MLAELKPQPGQRQEREQGYSEREPAASHRVVVLSWSSRSALGRGTVPTSVPMLVDTHVHLYSDAYDADRREVVQRATEAGVEVLLLPAVDVASIDAALALGDAHPGVFAMAGLHPTYLADAPADAFATVERMSRDPRIVAIGETGLDYYWSRDHIEAQRASLAAHARLAIAA